MGLRPVNAGPLRRSGLAGLAPRVVGNGECTAYHREGHFQTWSSLPLSRVLVPVKGVCTEAMVETSMGFAGHGSLGEAKGLLQQATWSVPYRVGCVYMSSVTFITLLIASDNPNLLGGKGVTA